MIIEKKSRKGKS